MANDEIVKKGKTTLEKCLIGGVVVLSLAAIGLLVGLIVVATSGGEEDQNLCLTPGCIETANMLMKNMNMTADP